MDNTGRGRRRTETVGRARLSGREIERKMAANECVVFVFERDLHVTITKIDRRTALGEIRARR